MQMAETTTKTPKTTKTRPVTPAASITPEALEAMLANMAELRATVARYQAEAEAVTKAMSNAKPATSKSAENEWKTIKAFKKAGFKDVKPRENVLTFNKWMELGRRPVEGSKSLRINNLRLFHIDQTRPLTKADQAKIKEQKQAFEARKAKVVPINGASPQ
jgi:hypothetical protein